MLDTIERPVGPFSAATVEQLLTYKVPAVVEGGACSRALADAPFDLRTVLFDDALAAGSWYDVVSHPETSRVARLRAAAAQLSKSLNAEWVGIYRVVHVDGMYVGGGTRYASGSFLFFVAAG